MVIQELRYTDIMLLIFTIALIWSCWRAHKDKSHAFNLFDLLMEHGRLSRLACAFIITLVVTTWIMVRLSIDGKMTEGYLIAFGGMWVAPIIAKLFSTNPSAPDKDEGQEK